MDILKITTETTSYPVYLGSGILGRLKEFLEGQEDSISQILLIADETVYGLYGDLIQSYMPSAIGYSVYPVPAGEEAKTLETFEKCMTFAIERGLDRKSCIVAFGGGACGDLAGFVASTYMRGIRFIGLPTTILAHDSSVGGKVAVNHRLGKNLIGQFYHPEAVIYDTLFLQSLPLTEVRSGMAEVIKHALISDKKFYDRLLKNLSTFTVMDESFLIDCLKQGISTKAQIVSSDEREAGIRAYLNFGHTYGHALENLEGYKGVSHGEAVMTGMIYALFLSVKHAGLSFDLQRFIEWTQQLGYPSAYTAKYPFEEIYSVMTRDKKAANKIPRLVLLKDLGEPVLMELSKSELEEAHNFISKI